MPTHLLASPARAREHLNELIEEHKSVCNAISNATVITGSPPQTVEPGKTVRILSVDNTQHPEIPERVSILVGDVVSDLRAAINYLIVQLARRDLGGAEPKRAQFPIEKDENQFNGQTTGKGFLASLAPATVELLRPYQPFSGCTWTQRLADLSNFDKHVDLILVQRDQILTLDSITSTNADGKPHIKFHAQLRPDLCIHLCGSPVVDTLEELLREVKAMLEAFMPEFAA